MPRRVLSVCLRFPPVNAPDHHRVRMSLPYLADWGWEAEVLATAPEAEESHQDATLLQTLPDTTVVHRVRPLPARWTRRAGLGDLALRSWLGLEAAGSRLLSRKRFDLVFFSTTAFPAMALGAWWRGRYGTPYVLDFQDPWVSDYQYARGSEMPGGRLKYGLSQLLAKALEPRSVTGSAHVIAVSPAYVHALRRRYPRLPRSHFTVLPFGGPEADFALLARARARQSVFDPSDGLTHLVHVGRGGADMALPLSGLFRAVARLGSQRPGLLGHTRFHFIGTNYARGERARPVVAPLARECGVGHLVQEVPERIPYLESLAVMRDSHAVLVMGSDDAGYSPSKVYPCVLSGRPLLAVLHRESALCDLIERWRAGEVVRFSGAASAAKLEEGVEAALARVLSQPRGQAPDTDWAAFAPYTAREMTRKLCAVFDAVARRGWGEGRP